MARILLVDDDEKTRQCLIEVLEEEGHSVRAVGRGEAALKRLGGENYSLVITDLMMPGMDGMEVLREVKKLRPRTKVIVITAFGTIDNAVDAMRRGASDYIVKPFDSSEIVAKVGRVLEEARFEDELADTCLPEGKVSVLKSLAHPTRLEVVELLGNERGFRFIQIKENLGIKDPTKLSFHLRELRKTGILEQDNSKKYYLAPLGRRVLGLIRDLR